MEVNSQETIQRLVQERLEKLFKNVYPVTWYNDRASIPGHGEFVKPYYSSIKCTLPVIRCEVCVENVDTSKEAADLVVEHVQSLADHLGAGTQYDLLISPLTAKFNHDEQKHYVTFRCVPYSYDGQALSWVQRDIAGNPEVQQIKHMPLSLEPVQVLLYNENACQHAQAYEKKAEFVSALIASWNENKSFISLRLSHLFDRAENLDRLSTLEDNDQVLAELTEMIGANPLVTFVGPEGQRKPVATKSEDGSVKFDANLVFQYIVNNCLDAK